MVIDVLVIYIQVVNDWLDPGLNTPDIQQFKYTLLYTPIYFTLYTNILYFIHQYILLYTPIWSKRIQVSIKNLSITFLKLKLKARTLGLGHRLHRLLLLSQGGLCRPKLTRHDMLRFYVRFLECHLTVTSWT